MKRSYLFIIVLSISILVHIEAIAQLEVKGSGSTHATMTFITKNNLNDTSLIILDDNKVGIDTSNPQFPLDVNGVIMARFGVRFPWLEIRIPCPVLLVILL